MDRADRSRGGSDWQEQGMTDKPTRGRPPKPADQIAQQVSVRLTPARKAKYLALGGNAWLNKAIDRAKVKE